ncbi:hypothetical protein [Rubritalea tangerina]|uniref:Lipoprotein n=1 Tax=Rubritalea tangerina TaxID=430798 RepID=A0ABW4ZA12_9BACT
MKWKSAAMALAGMGVVWASSCSPAQRFYQAQTAVPKKPWQGTSGKWGGYSDTRLSGGGHKVQFTGYNEPDANACAYFVTVRAAELAVLDGQMGYYSKGPSTQIDIEESNFPERVIPGYWDDVPVVDYISDGQGNVVPVTTYRSVWVPPERIPPHTAINKINRATMTMDYSGGGKRYDALSILQGAHTNQQKLGRVTIDPKVVAILKGKQ